MSDSQTFAAGLADSAVGKPVGEEVLGPSLPSTPVGKSIGLSALSLIVSSLLKKQLYKHIPTTAPVTYMFKISSQNSRRLWRNNAHKIFT